jgi:hypothetical protein
VCTHHLIYAFGKDRVVTRRGEPARAFQVLAIGMAFCGVGCLDDGPAIEARSQQITFDPILTPDFDQSSLAVSAHASSGLPVAYSSLTPSRCSVGYQSGVVTGEVTGVCTIEANQLGDVQFAPARPATQSITFRFTESISLDSVDSLRTYDSVQVRAIDTLGATVTFGTSTPLVCSVDSTTGVVVGLAQGICTIVASAGLIYATQNINIVAPGTASAPAVPQAVSATSGGTANSVKVFAQSITSGGSSITEYSVTSIPPGISASSSTLPVVVKCASSCGGYAFSLTATNAMGSSPASAAVDVITTYSVATIFHEPDTQPNESIFLGDYVFDATTKTVSGLSGRLSEAMTGSSSPYPNDTMNWLTLGHQLSMQPINVGAKRGLLVTTFLLTTTSTLASDPAFGGTDGWTPGTGMGLHYAYPGTNPGNAYVTVFVNTEDPLSTPTADVLDKLAYADCAPGGMMGASCMTGTSIAGYGSLGTMSGYPISQVTVQQ